MQLKRGSQEENSDVYHLTESAIELCKELIRELELEEDTNKFSAD